MNKMTLKEYIQDHLLEVTLETLYMVGLSALIAIIFAIIIGSLLYLLRKNKNKVLQIIYKIINIIINIFRSFPFLILIFWLIPFTRGVMKIFTGNASFTGNKAAIVPLAVAAIPFFTKLVENALVEVDDGVVEAATALGFNKFQIISRVVLREALPAIISSLTLGIITLIGYTAMAGAVGAGGIGNFAITYGQQQYDQNAMIYAVITVIILVQIIQMIGNLLYKLTK